MAAYWKWTWRTQQLRPQGWVTWLVHHSKGDAEECMRTVQQEWPDKTWRIVPPVGSEEDPDAT